MHNIAWAHLIASNTIASIRNIRFRIEGFNIKIPFPLPLGV
jgi:hypothetical protein